MYIYIYTYIQYEHLLRTPFTNTLTNTFYEHLREHLYERFYEHLYEHLGTCDCAPP